MPVKIKRQAGTTVLRLQRVEEKTGLSKSSIYSQMAAGLFPRPIRLGDRAVGWIEEEISAWVVERQERDRVPAYKRTLARSYERKTSQAENRESERQTIAAAEQMAP